MNKLTRIYLTDKKHYLSRAKQDEEVARDYRKNLALLKMIPTESLHGQKPSPCWTRKHDVDLMLGSYEHGMGNYERFHQNKNLIFWTEKREEQCYKRMTDRVKLIIFHLKRFTKNLTVFNFEDAPVSLHEIKNEEHKQPLFLDKFSKNQKEELYQILINFGIPVMEFDELKEDYELLRVLL